MAQGKQGADFATVATMNEQFKDKGGYVGFMAKSAEYQASESAGGLSKKIDMLENPERMNTMMRGLEAEGVQIQDFMQEDGNAKTGASLVAAMAGNRVKKFNMKDSLVDDLGRSVDFAMSDDGSIGKMSIDGVKSTSSGRVQQNHTDLAMSMAYFNKFRTKENQVGLDEKGNYTGTPEAIEAFQNHYENKQISKSSASIISETGGFIMDGLGAEIGEAVVMSAVAGFAGKKLLWDQIKPKSVPSPDPKFMKDSSNNSKNSDSKEGTPKSNETHINTPEERYNFAQTQIDESRANLENYNEERSQLQEKNKGLAGQIQDAMTNTKIGESKRSNIIENATTQMEENDRRITGLNQSIHDEEVSLEHRKQMASDALHDKDFGKAPKGRVGRFMEAAGNISSNAWESIQARTGSMDEVLDNFQTQAKRFITEGKGLLKSGARGMGVGLLIDTAAGESSQYLVDNGHYRSANVAQGIGNASNAFFDTVLGVASVSLGSVDTVSNAMFGVRPIGSATQVLD